MSRLFGKTLRTSPAISPGQEDVVLGGEDERGDAAGGRAVRNRPLALVRGRRPADARVGQPGAERRRRHPAVEGERCELPRMEAPTGGLELPLALLEGRPRVPLEGLVAAEAG